MDFKKLRIIDGKYWDVFLHQDQTVLGKLYFWYKEEASDLLTIPKEALVEFYDLGNQVKFVLIKLFRPDMFNYLSLNNITKHLHIHLIPRYARRIELFGLIFDDSSFGKSYKRNPEFIVSEETLIDIKNKICSELK